ncbi:MAG TPA: hypothetical protein VHY79_15330 [Rhizomicrobium sp.]|jgi:hypothetical protein|nr:hypothetical protein [Rhizomicrobium sp.]
MGVFDFGSVFSPAFGTFDAYTVLMLVFVGIGAAFTMRSIGSIVTATIAALVVFATAIFMRGVVSTGFSTGEAASLIHNDWTVLWTMQFGTLCVYALVVAFIIATSYGVLLLTRQ